MGEQSYISTVIDHVHVVRWLAPAKSDIERLGAEILALPQDQKWAAVHINPADLVTPDLATVRAFTPEIGRYFKHYALVVVVFDGSGIRVTLNRTMVKGMLQVAGLGQRVHVVPAIEAGFYKLQSYTRMSRPNFLEEMRRLALI